MPAHEAWLAPLLGEQALPAGNFAGDKAEAIWLPNDAIAKAWEHYIKDTSVPDTTTPPAPTNLQVTDGELTWNAQADLESGIAHFIIRRDGQQIGTVPEKPKNPFGRPIFQGLQYSDTPLQPLVEMRFVDLSAKPNQSYTYSVIAVNTLGLESP